MEYRYQHFSPSVIVDELRAMGRALRPGEPLPAFALPTTTGGMFDTSQVVGRRPLVLTFASFT
jgi:hypothetical protein